MRHPDTPDESDDPQEDAEGLRRRRLPGLTMLAALGLVAALVWADLLQQEGDITNEVSCSPAPGETTATPVRYRALGDVAPLPPSQVEVRVRNSTSQSGLAARVTARLKLLGFTATPPDNDPLYPTGTMHCVGQIRFGPDGRSAARTLSLVAPCAQLVRDDRTDASVDLALGTGFISLEPNDEAREVLEHLRNQATEQKQSTGGLQSLSPDAAPVPSSSLAGARPGRC